MSPLFSKKKDTGGKTFAILDIESGSVGAALAWLSPHDAPKLFAETRIPLPIHKTRDSVALARAVEKATEQALLHISHVAARVRAHVALEAQGVIERVVVFMSPPWASMHLSGGSADFASPMQDITLELAKSLIGPVQTSFHPQGSAAAHGSALLFPSEAANLLCIIGGEISELLVFNNNTIFGRATVPVGQRALTRTLVAHGTVSPAEAQSFMNLAKRDTHPLFEPMRAAEDHIASTLTQAAGEVRSSHALEGVTVLAHEPYAEIVARALARSQSLAQYFPSGGNVRSLSAHHAMPYFAAHGRKPDITLMLEALFAERKFLPTR